MKKLFCAVLLGALTLTPSFAAGTAGGSLGENPYTFLYMYKPYFGAPNWVCVYSTPKVTGGVRQVTVNVYGSNPTCPVRPF